MLDQIPTEVANHSKARTDGVSSSDVLGCCPDHVWGGPWLAARLSYS